MSRYDDSNLEPATSRLIEGQLSAELNDTPFDASSPRSQFVHINTTGNDGSFSPLRRSLAPSQQQRESQQWQGLDRNVSIPVQYRGDASPSASRSGTPQPGGFSRNASVSVQYLGNSPQSPLRSTSQLLPGSPRGSPVAVQYNGGRSPLIRAREGDNDASFSMDSEQDRFPPPGVIEVGNIVVEGTGEDAAYKRDALEDDINWEVNHLYDFFKGLYQKDQEEIERLRRELDQQGRNQSVMYAVNPMVGADVDYTDLAYDDQHRDESETRSSKCWRWCAQHWCLSACLLFLLLLLIILLSVLLQPKKHSIRFTTAPTVQLLGSGFADIGGRLSAAASVYYVLVPTAQNTSSKTPSAADVISAALVRRRDVQLQDSAVACGSSYWVRSKTASNVLTLASQRNSTECALLQLAGVHDCSRCGILVAGVNYTVYMVAATSKAKTATHVLQVVLRSASTPTVSSSSSSSLAVGFGTSDKASLFSSVPALSNVHPTSFDLSFALSGPGTIHYRIYRTAVFVRHAGTQIVYANALCSAEQSLATNASDFASGMVAGGEVAVLGTDARTVTIAPECIGQVCSITPAALVPNTAYKVVLIPEMPSIGTGQPFVAEFTTPADTKAPVIDTAPNTAAPDSGIISSIGGNSFTLSLAQNQLGAVRYIVTKPLDQLTAKASLSHPGAASALTQLSRRRGRLLLGRTNNPTPADTTYTGASYWQLPGRSLQQATDVTVESQSYAMSATSLQVELQPSQTEVPGAVLFPNVTQYFCDPSAKLDQVCKDFGIDTTKEACTDSGCVVIKSATAVTQDPVDGSIQDDTAYNVHIASSSTSGAIAMYSMSVWTLDMSPPSFVNGTPAITDLGFTYITPLLQLTEPSSLCYMVIEWLDRSTSAAAPSARNLFDMAYKGQITKLKAKGCQAVASTVTLNITGLQSNTKYDTYWIAEDVYGNEQATATVLLAQTNDNIPPNWIHANVTGVQGTNVTVAMQLDEASTIYYTLLPNGTVSSCPSSAQIFASPLMLPVYNKPFQDVPFVLGNLTSETFYKACFAAEDVVPFHNRQVASQYVEFTTLDITPPAINATLLSVACDRSTKLCKTSLLIKLNEDSIVTYALSQAQAATTTVTAQQMLASGVVLNTLFTAVVASAAATPVAAFVELSVNATLQSQSAFWFYVAAQDTHNNTAKVATVTFTTPDVTPPLFVGAPSVVSVNETNAMLQVQINEHGTVYALAQLSSTSAAATPTIQQVIANGTAMAAPGASAAVRIPLTGLSAFSNYTVYLAASDAAGNNQTCTDVLVLFSTCPVQLRLTTPDTTPPMINLSCIGSIAAGNSMLVNVYLSEAAAVGFVVFKAVVGPASPPKSADIFNASMWPAATGSGVMASPLGSSVVQISNLTDDTLFKLYVAAKDRADNLNAVPQSCTFLTPDTTPPVFQGATPAIRARLDTNITVDFNLNEDSTVRYSVTPDGQALPTAVQLFNGTTRQLTVGSMFYSQPSQNVTVLLPGLLPSTYYTLCAVANDTTGNRQTNNTCRRFRTRSLQAPAMVAAVTYKQPGQFNISATLTAPGYLYYVVVIGGAQAPNVTEVVQGIAPQQVSSGSLLLNSSLSGAALQCVLQGGQLDVWALTSDLEFEPGMNFQTTATKLVTTTVAAPVGSCTGSFDMSTFATPQLAYSVPPNLGWAIGTPAVVSPAAYSQKIVWFATGFNASVQATVAAQTLPSDNFLFEVTRRPPKYVTVAVRNTDLYLDDVYEISRAGRQLGLAYQLRDALQLTSVDVSLTTLNVTLKSGTTTYFTATCDVQAITVPEAVGVCTVDVSSTVFPVAGQAARGLDVVVDLVVNNVKVTSVTASSAIRLFPRPVPSAVPDNGLAATLPFRGLIPGDMVAITLAANSTTTISSFTINLNYDKTALQYKQCAGGSDTACRTQIKQSVWQGLSIVPDERAGTLSVSASRDTTQPASLYQGVVQLFKVYFTVQRGLPAGKRASAFSINLSTSTLITGTGSIPKAAVTSRSGTVTTGVGDIYLLASSLQSVFAYIQSPNIFNTAPLTGDAIQAPVTAITVSNIPTEAPATATSFCSLPTASSAVNVVNNASGCFLVADVNSDSAASVAVSVTAATIPSGPPKAALTVAIWKPEAVRITAGPSGGASSVVLRQAVPFIKATTASCSSLVLFQNTALQALADWSNTQAWLNSTVATSLVKFMVASSASAQSAALSIVQNRLQGISPCSNVPVTTITYSRTPPSITPVTVSVSNETVCLTRVDIVPVIGATWTPALSADSDKPWPGTQMSVVLARTVTWENQRALLPAWASFADSSYMDVTSFIQDVKVSDTLLQASTDAAGLTSIASAAVVGSPRKCPTITASWAMCGQTLATNSSFLSIEMPTHAVKIKVTVSATRIARSRDAATLEPFNIGSTAQLQVAVTFDDGVVRDFTNDTRIVLTLVAGSTLCNLSAQNGYVTTVFIDSPTSSSGSGTCTVQVSLAAQLSLQGSPATVSVSVVSVQQVVLYMQNNSAAAALGAAALPTPTSDGTYRIYKCDFSNYEQRSLWMAASLTDGTFADITPYATFQSADDFIAPIKDLSGVQPVKAGIVNITGTWGAASLAATVGLTVRDMFAAGAPNVLAFADSWVSLNMGTLVPASGSSVTLLSSKVTPAMIGAVTPDQVISGKINGMGTLNQFTLNPATSAVSYNISALAPATSYNVFITLKDTSTSTDQYQLSSVLMLSNITTRDTLPPTFTSVAWSPNVNPPAYVDEVAGKFSMNLIVNVSKPSLVCGAAYIDDPCLTGRPTVAGLLSLDAAGLAVNCSCSKAWMCQPIGSTCTDARVAPASAALQISGALYQGIRADLGASFSQDYCNNATTSSTSFSKHRIYLAAQDYLPNYAKGTTACAQKPSSGSCSSVATVVCSYLPPAAPQQDTPNVQKSPFLLPASLTLDSSPVAVPPALAPAQALALPFTMAPSKLFQFLPKPSALTSTSPSTTSIVITIYLTRPGIINYRLATVATLTAAATNDVYFGRCYIADPRNPCTVTVSQTCTSGALDGSNDYVVWYRAADNYGIYARAEGDNLSPTNPKYYVMTVNSLGS